MSRRLNFWLAASCAAKFIRVSIAPLENHDGPRSQPATSGGSNNCCPMFAIGVSASFTENPVQPTSLIDRATNSAGHEYLEYRFAASVNCGDSSSVWITGRISKPLV